MELKEAIEIYENCNRSDADCFICSIRKVCGSIGRIYEEINSEEEDGKHNLNQIG